jgi:hypothetical protein
MKLETLADIIKIVKPLLKAKIIFYTILILALAFWIAHLFPQVFVPLGLDAWRANNAPLIGGGVIATSALLIIALLVNLDRWTSDKLRVRREKHQLHNLLQGLSHKELVYLFQYIKHNTLLVEFDETDPVVGLLSEKGFIYPSVHVRIGSVVSYSSNYHHGQTFEMSPALHSYLMNHLEIFGKPPQRL